MEGSQFDKEDGAGLSMELQLKDVVNSRGGKWDLDTKLDCKCTLSVKIDGNTMTNIFAVDNTGAEAFDFQVLLHTYYMVAERKALDGSACNVKGLKGYAVADKVTGEEYTLESDDPITIQGDIVDRVYTPTDKVDLDVVVATGPGHTITLKANGEVDGKAVPVSSVVWNPISKAKGMGDFGDDQFADMICVEPGLLSNVPSLEGGKTATLTQVITSV